MRDYDEDPSPERETLLLHLLPRSQVAYVEEKFPGVIDLALVRRTRAIVTVTINAHEEPTPIFYHLDGDDENGYALQVESPQGGWIRRDLIELWGYAAHRACKAMLALRNGHKEYSLVRAQKKAKADV